jgi:hypothetical protein
VLESQQSLRPHHSNVNLRCSVERHAELYLVGAAHGQRRNSELSRIDSPDIDFASVVAKGFAMSEAELRRRGNARLPVVMAFVPMPAKVGTPILPAGKSSIAIGTTLTLFRNTSQYP